MIFALLPVKEPARSKERLAGLLSPAGREQLVWLMYRRTLEVLLSVRGFDRLVVASSNAAVLDCARDAGVMTIAEETQDGHNQSADRAAQICADLGAATVAMVPIDVPLVTGEDFASLSRAAGAAQLIVVPSSDGTGTNALVRTPPGVIESRFGPGSFAAHVGQAREKGLSCEVLRPAGLVFDLDTPEDARIYLERSPGGPIAELLAEAVRRNNREARAQGASRSVDQGR